ncbi:RidA family protein [Defluviimonas sp. SAOS-178_SWC]|uniref:RidA family protein n=1 Tax=Defluviimonas sp. SAOS-178_SWC TaxID=3121287 RepID=UPI0032215C0D
MSGITRIEIGKRMSNAVIHGGVARLAGIVGEPGGDVTQQTKDCVAEIDRLLALAGSDKTRILRAQIWLADINRDFAAMNAVWDQWVPEGHTPARATGEAKLATPDYLVEIIIDAAVA